jgi:hypothetical protein
MPSFLRTTLTALSQINPLNTWLARHPVKVFHAGDGMGGCASGGESCYLPVIISPLINSNQSSAAKLPGLAR